jgi:hypothetical protein
MELTPLIVVPAWLHPLLPWFSTAQKDKAIDQKGAVPKAEKHETEDKAR